MWTIDQGEKDASRDAYKQTKDTEHEFSTVASPPPKNPSAVSVSAVSSAAFKPPSLQPVEASRTVDLLSLDDSPPRPPPLSTPAVLAPVSSLDIQTASSGDNDKLFVAAAILSKQGQGKGQPIFDNDMVRLSYIFSEKKRDIFRYRLG